MLNALRPGSGESIVVFGVGAVGLSALMAAKIAGCDPIIVVDIHDHRLALAHELGATHLINHKGRDDVVGEIREVTGGGARYTVEASAEPKVLREAIDCLIMAGTCALLGSARRGTDASFRDAVPAAGPRGPWRRPRRQHPAGVHPQTCRPDDGRQVSDEKMITFYDFADINKAVQEILGWHCHQAGAADAGLKRPHKANRDQFSKS